MNWKKLAAAGLIAIGTIGTIGMISGCGGSSTQGKSQAPASSQALPTKIVAGMDDTFAPMGFRDDQGNIVGFDIDMANAISKKIGVPIEFKPIDWASKETELDSGRIDCIWNGFTMTPERQKKLSFTKPYMDNVQEFVVRVDSPYQSIDDLKGKKIAIQEASTAEESLNKDPDMKNSFESIKTYPDLTSCFMDLESGRVDAVMSDRVLNEYYMTKKPNEYRELPGEFAKATFSIGIKKGNQQLVDLLNKGIDEVIADGEASQISQKWFGKDVIKK